MSTETLRRAAALMRERSIKAEARRWHPSDHHDGMDEMPWFEIVADLPGDDPINEFVESWHPGAALAVADWLEDLANRITLSRALRHDDEETQALAVARAYLGEDA